MIETRLIGLVFNPIQDDATKEVLGGECSFRSVGKVMYLAFYTIAVTAKDSPD